ncbi:MAG TPA: glycosyltransferase family 39 protein [Caulobacteraceae bacterium]|jgi:4-amino-4-deoxy-L-arabinose transferase-like glycosyltransferase
MRVSTGETSAGAANAWLRRAWPVLAIVALWAAASLPWAVARSLIYEEGANAVLGQDILARGDLLRPELYGVVWLEKPSLLAWLIAATGWLTGGVGQWAARLPAMLSVLGTALLVFRLTRREASRNAALVAALAFMFCPLLLQKLSVAEPDTLITFLSFAAFCLWEGGVQKGRVGLWRWLGCGALLAALVMCKGPQPAAFFVLGVTAETALARRWRDIPGLALCFALPALALAGWGWATYRPGAAHAWGAYMRVGQAMVLKDNLHNIGELALELLPMLLIAPLAFAQSPGAARNPRVRRLALYAGITTLILLPWPGMRSRYAMPIAPAVAVLAGIAWDSAAVGWRLWLRRGARAILIGLVVVQLALSLAGPLVAPGKFGDSRRAGEAIAAAVRADPAPLYCASHVGNHPDTNQLFYVGLPMRCLPPETLEAIRGPAWLEDSHGEIDALLAARPDLVATRRIETSYAPIVEAVRLDERPAH